MQVTLPMLDNKYSVLMNKQLMSVMSGWMWRILQFILYSYN